MSIPHRKIKKGFSLVELLAVVLVLAVLAAVAVPLYLNTRKTAAARACKANINAIASAQAAYALRNGNYATMAQLVASGPESLSSEPKCPLNNKQYLFSTTQTGTTNDVTSFTAQFFIVCPDAATHHAQFTDSSVADTDWQRPMSAITNSEATP